MGDGISSSFENEPVALMELAQSSLQVLILIRRGGTFKRHRSLRYGWDGRGSIAARHRWTGCHCQRSSGGEEHTGNNKLVQPDIHEDTFMRKLSAPQRNGT